MPVFDEISHHTSFESIVVNVVADVVEKEGREPLHHPQVGVLLNAGTVEISFRHCITVRSNKRVRRTLT